MWSASLVLVFLLLPATGANQLEANEVNEFFVNVPWSDPRDGNITIGRDNNQTHHELNYMTGLVMVNSTDELLGICRYTTVPTNSTNATEATTEDIAPTVTQPSANLSTTVTTVNSTVNSTTVCNTTIDANCTVSNETSMVMPNGTMVSPDTVSVTLNSTTVKQTTVTGATVEHSMSTVKSTVSTTTTTTTTTTSATEAPTTTTETTTVDPPIPLVLSTMSEETTTTKEQEPQAVMLGEASAQSGEDKEDNNSGMFIGIAITAVVLVLIAGVAVAVLIVLVKRRNKKAQKKVELKKTTSGNKSLKTAVFTQEKSKQPSPDGSPKLRVGGKPHLKRKPINQKPTEKSLEEQEQPELEPRNMEHGKIDKETFQFMGPLTLEAGQKGPIRHGTEGFKSSSLKDPLEFDPTMNKVYDIGSEIEHVQPEENLTGGNSVVLTEDDNTLILDHPKSRNNLEKVKSKKTHK